MIYYIIIETTREGQIEHSFYPYIAYTDGGKLGFDANNIQDMERYHRLMAFTKKIWVYKDKAQFLNKWKNIVNENPNNTNNEGIGNLI